MTEDPNKTMPVTVEDQHADYARLRQFEQDQFNEAMRAQLDYLANQPLAGLVDMAGKDIYGNEFSAAFHERAANPPEPSRWHQFRYWLADKLEALADWINALAWRVEP